MVSGRRCEGFTCGPELAALTTCERRTASRVELLREVRREVHPLAGTDDPYAEFRPVRREHGVVVSASAAFAHHGSQDLADLVFERRRRPTLGRALILACDDTELPVMLEEMLVRPMILRELFAGGLCELVERIIEPEWAGTVQPAHTVDVAERIVARIGDAQKRGSRLSLDGRPLDFGAVAAVAAVIAALRERRFITIVFSDRGLGDLQRGGCRRKAGRRGYLRAVTLVLQRRAATAAQ